MALYNKMLVRAPDETVTLCPNCLRKALKFSPLAQGEYVLDSEADCEECGIVSDPRNGCRHCGQSGEMTGHMGCQYPQN